MLVSRPRGANSGRWNVSSARRTRTGGESPAANRLGSADGRCESFGRQIIYGAAGPARTVDRVDERERLISLLTRDERRASRANRLAEVEKLSLERFHGDGHRIGCA